MGRRAWPEVVLGHPSSQSAVAGGRRRDERYADGGEVGEVALQSGQPLGLGLRVAVDGFGGVGERDEPVALNRARPSMAFSALAGLPADAAQGAAGAVVAASEPKARVEAGGSFEARCTYEVTVPRRHYRRRR